MLRKGIIYMIIAAFCFSLSGAITRLLGNKISSVELVLFRNVIGVAFIFTSIWQKPLQQVGGKLFLLVFRGIIGTLALYLFFYGITKIGLPEAITYQQSYPIILALFSYFFLGEILKKNEIWAIVVGFSGICLIFLPQMGDSLFSAKNHFIGIVNMIFTALAYLSIRGLSKYYDGRAIVMSFMLSGLILPLCSLTIGHFYPNPALDFILGSFVMPAGKQWFWILLLGISAMIGQIFLTKAFTYGKAGPISVAGYSNIIFSILFGILLGDPLPSTTSLLGICFVISSGFLIAKKEK